MSRPYAGAPVTQKFRERWLSARMFGGAKPVASVQIRRGRLNRTHHPYPDTNPPFGTFPGVFATGYWYPDWQVNSDWEDLDGIQNVKFVQDFTNNGITTMTLVMDNVGIIETSGHAGTLYHVFEQGYYSPLRGYVGPHRPHPGVDKTPFFEKLPNAQIRVMQGYGEDEMVCTFLGLIDDIDTETNPKQLTVTGRDHGGVLVDQRFFGWAKDIILPTPVTFAPRRLAEKTLLVGGDARASSSRDGYDPAAVLKQEGSAWYSASHESPDHLEHIEITLPEGLYSQIYLGCEFDGMEAYIAIAPRSITDTSTLELVIEPSFNGEAIEPGDFTNGFWDPDGNIAPGGDWPYFDKIAATKKGEPVYINLRGEFRVGPNTVLRVGFRKLGKIDGDYYAGVNTLLANQRSYNQAAIVGRYVIIDDIADIVRCCLRWCGFKGWEVENTGVVPTEPYVAGSDKTMMDVINEWKNVVGYTFFISEPRDPEDDQDLGYPIFRNARVLENQTGKTEYIDDKLLLTDAKVKFTNQDDHCIIRCRGIAVDDGVPLGSDSVKRIMFAYIPAWAAEQAAKVAGVLKPITHTDQKFTKIQDCEFGCYLIGIQIALSKVTAVLTLPANPGIGIDTLQSVIDRTQGLNSRIYVSNRTQEMQFGANGYWTMQIGGALVDTPDVVSVLADYKAAIQRIDRKGRNPWLRKRQGKTLDYGYQDK